MAPERNHPRYPVAWQVNFRCATWELAAKVATANVSRRGMFLRCKAPPVEGTALELTLQLPDGRALELEGIVRYVISGDDAVAAGRDPGAGVELDPRHDEELRLLEEAAQREVGGTAPLARVAVGTLSPREHAAALAAARANEPGAGGSSPPSPPRISQTGPVPAITDVPPTTESSTSYSIVNKRRKRDTL